MNDPENISHVLVRRGRWDKLFLPKLGAMLLEAGLRLHKAPSLKGRIFHNLLESRLGLRILTSLSVVQCKEPDSFRDFDWKKWTQCALRAIGVDSGWAAFSFSQNTDKRCMSLLIDREWHTACGFVKLAFDEEAWRLFQNEAEALKYLSAQGGLRSVLVPNLLHEGEYGHVYYFIQSVIPSQTHYLLDLKGMRWMSILDELSSMNRAQRPLRALRWWQELERSDKPTRSLLPLLKSEVNNTISVCCAHGDFSPGNILEDGCNVWVFDWEAFDKEAPIMTDYLSYVLEYFMKYRWMYVSNRMFVRHVLDYLLNNVKNANCQNLALAVAYHSTKRGWKRIDVDLCSSLCKELLARSQV